MNGQYLIQYFASRENLFLIFLSPLEKFHPFIIITK